jgi:hypothetical protein
MPNFMEIESDKEEAENFKEMVRKRGLKQKEYKKEKSLGVLCQ